MHEPKWSAKVVADSMGPNGIRVTSVSCTYPRFIHAQIMTHRLFSRNTASSRAIPSKSVIAAIEESESPVIFWGKNKSGMSPDEELGGIKKILAQYVWDISKKTAILYAKLLMWLGIHKQIANRILEPYMFVTCLITSSEWENFFNLRMHDKKGPQQEIRFIAQKIYEAINKSKPQHLQKGEWHLPFITPRDSFNAHKFLGQYGQNLQEVLKKMCVARCARISYLKHGNDFSVENEINLHDRLLSSKHNSPFEHQLQARGVDERQWCGNIRGWWQHRADVDKDFTHVISVPKG